MSVSRTIARPLLAAVFINEGWDAVRHPSARAKQASPVMPPIAEKVSILPNDTEKLVQINGAVMVGAGTLMALGKFRRLAALALIASIIPTTYAGHRFWEEEDDTTRAQQRIQFLKNLGLLGGLILEAFDTEGTPSLKWRATHHRAKREASSANEMAKHLGEAIGAAPESLLHVAEAGVPAIAAAGQAATKLPEIGNWAWKRARQRTMQIDIAHQTAALKEAHAAMLRAADSYQAAAGRAQKRAAKVDLDAQKVALKQARGAMRQALKQGRNKAQPLLAHSAEALQSAGVHAQPTLAVAAKALEQAKAEAQPVLSSAASRAADAWSRVSTSA